MRSSVTVHRFSHCFYFWTLRDLGSSAQHRSSLSLIMEQYGTSIVYDINDLEKEEKRESIRERCCWLLLLLLLAVAAVGLGMYFYGRHTHKHSNLKTLGEATEVIAHVEQDIVDEGLQLEGAIVNELNHPKAYRAMRIVRDILRKNKGGPVLDREFRRSYNIEQACCLPDACTICENIKWFCCDHQPEDDIYLPSMMELEGDHHDDHNEGDQKREEIKRRKQRYID